MNTSSCIVYTASPCMYKYAEWHWTNAGQSNIAQSKMCHRTRNNYAIVTVLEVMVWCVCVPTGWPLPPAQEPWCSVCPAGWATTTVDASSCTMCRPGHMAANPDSPACEPCPEGTYSSSWGSSQCSHCITGTYSPSQVTLAVVL